MNRYTYRNSSERINYVVTEFAANDEISDIFFPKLKDKTDILFSEKHFYKGDSYYKIGGGFDTESTTIKHTEKEKMIIEHCFCYLFQFAIGDCIYLIRTLQQFRHFIRQLINYLKTYETTKVNIFNKQTKHIEKVDVYPKLILWVANFSHEFSFIKSELQYFNVTKFFAVDERKPLLIEIENVLQFRECLGLFGSSLDDIAKNHTKLRKKGDFDYNLIRHAETPLTDTEKKYAEYDVMILSKMHEKVISDLAIKQGGAIVIPYTSTGYIRHECKEHIKNADMRDIKFDMCCEKKSNIDFLKMLNSEKFVSELQWKLCRNYSYTGGLCGSLPSKVCNILKDIWCFDLVSDYPAQMNHKLFPTGKLKTYHICKGYYEYTTETLKELKKEGKPFFVFMRLNLKAKTQHCVFSQHKIYNKEKATVIPVNGKVKIAFNANVIWNDIDLDTYKLAYDIEILEIYSIWYFEGYTHIPNYILDPLNNRYKDKCKLKKEGKKDTKEYIQSKRYVNGFYGMCSTKEHYEEIFFEDGMTETIENRTFLDLQKEFWLDPYIAFWTTSYARQILIAFITKYPDDIVQYDTDSLYINSYNTDLLHEIEEYNKKIIALNKKLFPNDEIMWDLGTFENTPDDRFDTFVPMGAKKYIKVHDGNITPVIAGLPKDTFENMIEKGYNVKKIITICKSIFDKPFVIDNMFHGKLASKYLDDINEKNVKITDYLGNVYIQTYTGYHALFDIDFKLDISDSFKKAL